MMDAGEHEIHALFRSLSTRLAESYERISRRSAEDPGTAGDEGEGTWAEVLRQWLPEGYSVAVKGRLLGADGTASPQVDLVVLKPSYPKFLKEQQFKYYLVDGVAAAFECKTTLRSGELNKMMATAKKIAALVPKSTESVQQAIMAPVVYGLLAQSHDWKSDPRVLVDRLTSELHELAATHATEPRELPELICIADLGGWRLGHSVYSMFLWGEHNVPDARMRSQYADAIGAKYPEHRPRVFRTPEYSQTVLERPHSEYQVQYMPPHTPPHPSWRHFQPAGAFIAALYDKLAYRDEALLNISRYFSKVHVPGASGGLNMAEGKLVWPRSILPDVLWEKTRDSVHGVSFEPGCRIGHRARRGTSMCRMSDKLSSLDSDICV